MQVENQKNERKRKLLLALPVLAFPFLTLMFWSLGGGQRNEAQGQETKQGFNSELPSAKNNEEPMDKMGFYTQAEKEEMERSKQMKKDPYYNADLDSMRSAGEALLDFSKDSYQAIGGSNNFHRGSYTEPDETKVYEKLNALQAALKVPSEEKKVEVNSTTRNQDGMSEDLDRLEQMVSRMNGNQGTEDPQMKQVNDVLERILDLQHPDRVQQRIKEASALNRGNVYPVSVSQKTNPVSLLSTDATGTQNLTAATGFFGLSNPIDMTSSTLNTAIRAVVHETQTLVTGSTVKLRIVDDVYINGIYLPKDQFVFGVANLSGERLNISIKSIRNNSLLFPVELNVYDMDGLQGIYIPGAIARDVAKQSGDRSLQGIGLTTLDPSLGAQAASAGIELTKNLVGKKIKLIKVQVKAGYQIILVDEKQNKSR